MQEASINKEPVKSPDAQENNNSYIDMKQFTGVDLRAARVIRAESVEGSDKLISCTLDVGELGHRQIFTGLRPHVEPHHLEGLMVVIVANLQPRTMRFGVSEGMILAVGEEKPCVLTVEGAVPGARVR